MQSIQIDGTFTYCNNIKRLKVGDPIKLILNPDNRINSDAIGAYTLNNEKIGYVPFKSNQIDIKAKYTVTKISLTQSNPILLISRNFDNSNFINIEPNCIKELKYNNQIITTNLKHELDSFKRFLIRSGNSFTNVGITFIDSNFINLLIESNDNQIMYYTVTKKYYEENVFKYDEFFKFDLTPKNIYQPFLIHRLECYIERNYKSIETLLKKKKFKFDNMVKNGIFEYFDKVTTSNFGFDKVESSNLKAIELNINMDRYKTTNLSRLLIRDNINPELNSTNAVEYLRLLNYEVDVNSISVNLDSFKTLYTGLKVGGLCYNHHFQAYCYIDLYDDINIIEITDINDNLNIDKVRLVALILKLVLSKRQIINIYDPLLGVILRLEVPEIIMSRIAELLE